MFPPITIRVAFLADRHTSANALLQTQVQIHAKRTDKELKHEASKNKMEICFKEKKEHSGSSEKEKR